MTYILCIYTKTDKINQGLGKKKAKESYDLEGFFLIIKFFFEHPLYFWKKGQHIERSSKDVTLSKKWAF